MFAKMALPVLGGAPSVWAVALCFFQGALLAGYVYAHLLTRYIAARYAGVLHVALMLVAMTSLPVALPAGWREPPPGDPYLWQLGLFAAGIGAPFVIIAANAPLLQAWFARTRHPHARDPYFLYAASNFGSLLALLAYPFLLEPLFGLHALGRLWAAGFIILTLALAVTAWVARPSVEAPIDEPDHAAPTGPRWQTRAAWVGLAFVPSALLTAFTTHIATDVASAPLIWVLPLSLYLLTFVLVFRDRPWLWAPVSLAFGVAAYLSLHAAAPLYFDTLAGRWVMAGAVLLVLALFTAVYRRSPVRQTTWLAWAQLGAVVVALLELSRQIPDTWFVTAAAGVAAFFLSALVAHRTLYESRPPARDLTQYYMWLSTGGVLGGLFSALVAPRLFTEVYEYPILLALTVACRPGVRLSLRPRVWVGVAALLAFGAVTIHWLPRLVGEYGWNLHGLGATTAVTLVFAAATLLLARYPAAQVVAALLMCAAVVELESNVNRGDAITKRRSYFGVYRVAESEDHDFHILTHGTTLHGAQRTRDDDGKPVEDYTPATYYYPDSPMARTVDLVRARLASEQRKGTYGVVGLGTGSLACLSQEGEHWRFFEIDPVIVDIASDPRNFTFLTHCQPQPDIVMGDARLTLSKQSPGTFDLIIVDAFSSDAIPVHLLTADAIRMYAARLTPEGVLLLHTSNRYLDLDAVLGATIPLVPELHGLLLLDSDAEGDYSSSNSTVGVFSKDDAVLDPFRALDISADLERGTLRPWTDDYSDLLGPFVARLTGG